MGRVWRTVGIEVSVFVLFGWTPQIRRVIQPVVIQFDAMTNLLGSVISLFYLFSATVSTMHLTLKRLGRPSFLFIGHDFRPRGGRQWVDLGGVM